jgi:hypothetical protein
MSPGPLYAVVTGDIVGSSKVALHERQGLLDSLDSAFTGIRAFDAQGPGGLPPFEVFRGDSFQGILERADQGLRAALLVRAVLRSQQGPGRGVRIDARVAIGIGPVQFLPGERVGTGDGDAYRFSGGELEDLKKRKVRLAVRTPWEQYNRELRTESALADAILRSWTPAQAGAVAHALHGRTQAEIAAILGISQEAVFYRLHGAKYWAIQEFLARYSEVISSAGRPGGGPR